VRVLEEREIPFQDVAVLMRTPGTYSDLFGEEMALLGARPYLETPPPLSRTRSGRALIKLAQAMQSDLARRDVLEFLSLADLAPVRNLELTGNPAAETDGTPAEQTDRKPDAQTDASRANGALDAPASDWNKATMLAGITSGPSAWTERLESLRERIDGASPEGGFASRHGHLAESIRALLPIASRLADDVDDTPDRSTVAGFLDRLTATFRDLTRESPERAAVLEATESLRAVSGVAGKIGFAYFTELLRGALSEPGSRSETFERGGPTVLNLMSARGLPFRAVIVPGLVEKEFPATRRQDPILLDSERERLNAARGDDPLASLPDRSAGADEEKLLFRLAVAAATEVAILSFPRLEPSTARPRIASIFVLKALETLTGERHDYDALETSEHVTRIPLSRRFPARREDALTRDEFDGCSILEAVATGDASGVAYLVHEDGPLPRRLTMESVRWSSPHFTAYDGAVSSKEALRAVTELSGFARGGPVEGRTVSATALEEYATCPFRFLMHHVFGIEPIEEPEEALELSPRDRGSLYHAVLDRFMKTQRSEGRLPLAPDDRARLFETAERLTRGGPWSLAGYPGARALELDALRSNLALWFAAELGDESGYEPRYFEARFGGRAREGDDPELSLEEGVPFEALGDVRVEFGGKIDRIDIESGGKRARVIDYKTGRPSGGRKVFDHGRRLQLPIYLLASRRMLAGRHPTAVVASAEYRYVAARKGTTSIAIGADQLEERAGDLSKAVGLIVKGIASGFFFQYPEDGRCRNCDYADACASTALALATMKNGDKRVKFFTEGLAEVE